MPDLEGEHEWLLMSAAIARMSELALIYRTYPGWARTDLENTIRAGRAALRGRSLYASDELPDASDELPAAICVPLGSSKYRIDLIHNALIERRPGPSGGKTLFRDVEIEWTGVVRYLRDSAAQRGAGFRAVRPKDSAESKECSISAKTRDAAILKRLSADVRPGSNCSWKEFCNTIRDEAHGWTDRNNSRPKWGFSDKQITRATRKLMGSIKDN